MKSRVWIALLGSMLLAASARGGSGALFSTWQPVEVDTCASAWLIKRFVDKDAQFRFVPKGELMEEGTPFDTPDAELRRYQNLSTYESILLKYHISDPKAVKVGEIIHDIEVNIWEKKRPESIEVAEKLRRLIGESPSAKEAVERSFEIFDDLCRRAGGGDGGQ